MTDQHIIQTIAHTIHVSEKQIQTALSLLQSGNTIPFIARYRKEATGMLNEIQLRQIQEQYEYEQALSSRREAVRQSIMEQGQWTEELGRLLDQAGKLQEIEDLYMPYKPKKRTKASMARDAGLEPLADIFWQQDPHGPSPEEAAASYLNETIPTIEDAIAGAANILAERMSELAPYRQYLRRALWKTSKLECALLVEEDEAKAMLTYKDFSGRIASLPSHRILAINRGEAQKLLKVTLTDTPDANIGKLIQDVTVCDSPYHFYLRQEPAQPAPSAALCRTGNLRPGPGIPHGLQGRRHRRDGQRPRLRRLLFDRLGKTAPRQRRHPPEHDSKSRRNALIYRKRHGLL